MCRFRLVFGIIFVGVVLFFSFNEVSAQNKYLVKIDVSSSEQIQKLKKTNALVYAKILRSLQDKQIFGFRWFAPFVRCDSFRQICFEKRSGTLSVKHEKFFSSTK